MKTTVEIPDDLFREAKTAAARDGTKLKHLVADGLRLVLGKTKPGARRQQFPLLPATPGTPRLTAAKLRQIEAAEQAELDSHHARPGRR